MATEEQLAQAVKDTHLDSAKAAAEPKTEDNVNKNGELYIMSTMFLRDLHVVVTNLRPKCQTMRKRAM